MTLAFDGLPPLRQVIAEHGLDAKKSLGQNFLLDLNLTGKIARAAGALKHCDVLEIGPGPGGLTRALLAEGARNVVALERDERCLPALQQVAAHYPGRLHVVAGDALTADVGEFLNAPVRIVANLPYNIGTELLVKWLSPPIWPPFWQSMTLMFQREVAQRIVAKPGSKAYGRLALLVNWRCNARIMFEIPPEAFTPAPKVTSAVVHFERLESPRFAADAHILENVVRQAFGQRRKMLRSSLRSISPNIESMLIASGIKPTDRAEQIDLERFCRLAELLSEANDYSLDTLSGLDGSTGAD